MVEEQQGTDSEVWLLSPEVERQDRDLKSAGN